MVKVFLTPKQYAVYKSYKRLQLPSLVARDLEISIGTVYMHLAAIGRVFKFDWKRKWAARGLVEVNEAEDSSYG